MVEVKQTKTEAQPVRRGILEAMAYLDDATSVIENQPFPHALVVGWNAKATPAFGRIVVADQDDVASAVDVILSAWSLGV
jgi:hypothetical protein